MFSDPTTKQGIIQDIDFLVDTDNNTYSLENKTRNINRALDWVTGLIIGSDGDWQWDDTNYTNLPIGTANITANQQDYSFANEHLYINALEIKTPTGEWNTLDPIDLYKQNNGDITDFEKVTGTPKYYDKVGNSIFLYPTPNYTSTSALKAHSQRKAQPFLPNDTTKEPGFAPHLHRYLSISASYDWAVAKEHGKQGWLLQEKTRYEQMIKDFYSKRSKDYKPRLIPARQNNK